VNHKVNVVQQYPLSLVVSFETIRAQTHLREVAVHFVGDSLNLAGIRSRADDKIIRKRTRSPIHLQDGNVFTFLTFYCLNDLGHLPPGSILCLAHSFLIDGSLSVLAMLSMQR